MSITENLKQVKSELPESVTLVAVSKTKPTKDIREALEAGHLHFGENKVQELVSKEQELPKEIHWHMIGHLQRNKVKYIAPFVYMIHSVDSERLLSEINKQARKNDRIIPCLLQLHIASEETKHGWDENELTEFLESGRLSEFKHIQISGLMGMATFTDDQSVIKNEFESLHTLFEKIKITYQATLNNFDTLSMGMSGDYKLAIAAGSTMVRVGSSIFGARACML